MHNYYPLAPEKLEISHDMLTNYCGSITNEYDIKIGGVNKIVPNWDNKSTLSLGMKSVNVHRILKFKQTDWLKNTFILIQTKGKMLLIVLKMIF